MAATVPNYSYIINQYAQNIQRKAEDAVRKIIPYVNREWYRMVDEKLRQSYKETIVKFYAGYSPKFYHRSRSLYDLIQTKIGNDSLAVDFDPSKMTAYRSGYNGEDGLYDLVFREGWHGGAKHGDYTRLHYGHADGFWTVLFTPHPSPGTPYYRTPYQVYTNWGEDAARSDAPLDVFKQKVAEYESDPNGAAGDYYRAWDKYKDKIVIRL